MKQEFYGLATSLESRTLTKDAKARLEADVNKVSGENQRGSLGLEGPVVGQ